MQERCKVRRGNEVWCGDCDVMGNDVWYGDRIARICRTTGDDVFHDMTEAKIYIYSFETGPKINSQVITYVWSNLAKGHIVAFMIASVSAFIRIWSSNARSPWAHASLSLQTTSRSIQWFSHSRGATTAQKLRGTKGGGLGDESPRPGSRGRSPVWGSRTEAFLVKYMVILGDFYWFSHDVLHRKMCRLRNFACATLYHCPICTQMSHQTDTTSHVTQRTAVPVLFNS